MNSNSKVFAALLIGIAAGAGLGLLFAPEKGVETREKLTGSLKNLGNSIKKTALTEFENLAGLKDKVVEGLKTKMSSPVAEYQDDLEHA